MNSDAVQGISHYLLPVLSIIIVGLCLSALLRRRQPSLGKAQLIDTRTGTAFPIHYRETAIGSGKGCDIRLGENDAAKMHAVIVCAKTGWYIADPSGKGTTLVNGLKVKKRADLDDGTRIQVGSVMFRFSVSTKAQKPQPEQFSAPQQASPKQKKRKQ